MLEPKLLIKASLDAGKEFFRPPESREEALIVGCRMHLGAKSVLHQGSDG